MHSPIPFTRLDSDQRRKRLWPFADGVNEVQPKLALLSGHCGGGESSVLMNACLTSQPHRRVNEGSMSRSHPCGDSLGLDSLREPVYCMSYVSQWFAKCRLRRVAMCRRSRYSVLARGKRVHPGGLRQSPNPLTPGPGFPARGYLRAYRTLGTTHFVSTGTTTQRWRRDDPLLSCWRRRV